MILVFGGAYQGKLEYTLKRFDLTESDIFRCVDDDAAVPGGRKVIYEIDKWILALIKAQAVADEAVREFLASVGDAVVICNDISCGVVPSDPLMREWRESVGRALAELAEVSDEVIRLFCGIAARVK